MSGMKILCVESILNMAILTCALEGIGTSSRRAMKAGHPPDDQATDRRRTPRDNSPNVDGTYAFELKAIRPDIPVLREEWQATPSAAFFARI